MSPSRQSIRSSPLRIPPRARASCESTYGRLSKICDTTCSNNAITRRGGKIYWECVCFSIAPTFSGTLESTPVSSAWSATLWRTCRHRPQNAYVYRLFWPGVRRTRFEAWSRADGRPEASLTYTPNWLGYVRACLIFMMVARGPQATSSGLCAAFSACRLPR